MLVHAPAKLNLCLYLGRAARDGLHELCSLFEPLALADLIAVAEAERDEVLCAGVEGENLAARALAALRERGWDAPPLRIEIEKRIPVAAGLGGGSADAAAVLRLAAGEVADLQRLAAETRRRRPLAAACPSLALVRGAGERVERAARPRPRTPSSCCRAAAGSRTAEVFAEADRLGLGRDGAELEALATPACARPPAPAPRRSPTPSCSSTTSSRPPARCARRSATRSRRCAAPGAPVALLTGSGPTAVGLFADLAAAQRRGRQASTATTRSSARPGTERR